MAHAQPAARHLIAHCLLYQEEQRAHVHTDPRRVGDVNELHRHRHQHPKIQVAQPIVDHRPEQRVRQGDAELFGKLTQRESRSHIVPLARIKADHLYFRTYHLQTCQWFTPIP